MHFCYKQAGKPLKQTALAEKGDLPPWGLHTP